MIRKKITAAIGYIFADEENFSLEHRLFLSSLIIGIIISICGSIINLVLSTVSSVAFVIPLLLSGIVIILYYFVRFKKIFDPFILPIVILSILGISAIWIYNGGINGSNIMPAFVILILGLIVVPEKLKIYIISLFVSVNIFILVVQLYRPELIINFPTETDRWIDNLLTTIYASILIFLIIRFVHKNYTLERTKAEESEKKLIQLNADKDVFLSILSHDLRSPLNALLNLSELLKNDFRKLNSDEIDKIAGQINKSARNTNLLLEDILMWARTQQGKIPFNPQVLSLREICNYTLETQNPAAISKNITINCTSAEEEQVFADIDMIKAIMRNLISNAIKFSDNLGIINISAERSDSEILISVSDNGIGVKPEDLPKLFDLSQIFTTNGTGNETGTGLGLMLVREFVTKHGGKVWAESEYGKGSRFNFTLPFSADQSVVKINTD
jgi:two-component system, sensor histidine kinase and response regulator